MFFFPSSLSSLGSGYVFENIESSCSASGRRDVKKEFSFVQLSGLLCNLAEKELIAGCGCVPSVGGWVCGKVVRWV